MGKPEVWDQDFVRCSVCYCRCLGHACVGSETRMWYGGLGAWKTGGLAADLGDRGSKPYYFRCRVCIRRKTHPGIVSMLPMRPAKHASPSDNITANIHKHRIALETFQNLERGQEGSRRRAQKTCALVAFRVFTFASFLHLAGRPACTIAESARCA